jgi:hypothetical protein
MKQTVSINHRRYQELPLKLLLRLFNAYFCITTVPISTLCLQQKANILKNYPKSTEISLRNRLSFNWTKIMLPFNEYRRFFTILKKHHWVVVYLYCPYRCVISRFTGCIPLFSLCRNHYSTIIVVPSITSRLNVQM